MRVIMRVIAALLVVGLTAACGGTEDAQPVGCRSAPADQRTSESAFSMTLTPNPVVAGATASLDLGAINPRDVAGWGGLWECWNGIEWVATHQIEHGRTPATPGAALAIEPGTFTTMPAIGYLIPDTFTITIPEVPPGWYRIREGVYGGGDVAVGYITVEVVAEG